MLIHVNDASKCNKSIHININQSNAVTFADIRRVSRSSCSGLSCSVSIIALCASTDAILTMRLDNRIHFYTLFPHISTHFCHIHPYSDSCSEMW